VETGVTVPSSITVNSFAPEYSSIRVQVAMQTGDFRWQFMRIPQENTLNMGKLYPRTILRSSRSPSGAMKLYDADGEMEDMFVTGFLSDPKSNKVYSTLTKIDSREGEVYYHIGLE
jgi:hypothetical protein